MTGGWESAGDRPRRRIDLVNFSIGVGYSRRDRQIEPPFSSVPYGLLNSVGGLWIPRSTVVNNLVQHHTALRRDESHKWRRVSIVGDQDDLILRIVCQFVGPGCPPGADRERNREGMSQIYDLERAVGVTYPEFTRVRLVELVVVTRSVDCNNAVRSGKTGDRKEKRIVFGIDHIDPGGHWGRGGGVASIGEVVSPGFGIDPTDVEAIETSRNGNGRQEFIRDPLVLVLVRFLGGRGRKNRKNR